MALRIEVLHELKIVVEVGVMRVDVVDDLAIPPAADSLNGHLFHTEVIGKTGEAVPEPVDANQRKTSFLADAIDLIV